MHAACMFCWVVFRSPRIAIRYGFYLNCPFVYLQVESMNSLFEKYRGFASKIFPKNQHLRKTFLDVVLSMTEILCKFPEELSSGDLAEAYSALRFVTKAGFKLDWLEKKLKETGKSRLQEIEEDLKDLKVKCADMDALLEFLR